MKLIAISRSASGYKIDPTAYLAQLPNLAEELPPGARLFAADAGHYDFTGRRCVKDLKLRGLAYGEENEETTIQLTLGHNCWKHEEDLIIRYVGVHDTAIDLGGQSG